MITQSDFLTIQKFADSLRNKVTPEKDDNGDYAKKMQNYCFQYFWDIIALTEKEFELELTEYSKELEAEYETTLQAKR